MRLLSKPGALAACSELELELELELKMGRRQCSPPRQIQSIDRLQWSMTAGTWIAGVLAPLMSSLQETPAHTYLKRILLEAVALRRDGLGGP